MPKLSAKEKIEKYFSKKGITVQCFGKDIIKTAEYALAVREIPFGLVDDELEEGLLSVSFDDHKMGTKIYGYLIDYYEEYAKENGFHTIQFSDDRLSMLQVLLDKGFLPHEHVEFWRKKL